jgi:hypothetical protein
MNNKERSTSMGTVIAFGFILLGVLNLFASRNYRRTTFSAAGIIPGILFISIGVTILIIRAIRKSRE